MPDIKAQLSKRYYFGDKWVGYKDDKGVLSVGDLFCFRDLNKQYLYHYNQWCCYQPIPTVLNSLNQEKRVGEHPLDEKRLLAQVQQYPIVAFHAGMDLSANLAKGDLFPVMYRKTIAPKKIYRNIRSFNMLMGLSLYVNLMKCRSYNHFQHIRGQRKV